MSMASSAQLGFDLLEDGFEYADRPRIDSRLTADDQPPVVVPDCDACFARPEPDLEPRDISQCDEHSVVAKPTATDTNRKKTAQSAELQPHSADLSRQCQELGEFLGQQQHHISIEGLPSDPAEALKQLMSQALELVPGGNTIALYGTMQRWGMTRDQILRLVNGSDHAKSYVEDRKTGRMVYIKLPGHGSAHPDDYINHAVRSWSLHVRSPRGRNSSAPPVKKVNASACRSA